MVTELEASNIESALRYLGTRDHGVLIDLLEHAIKRPSGTTGNVLAPLVAPTPLGWTPVERAHAVWRLIGEGVHDLDVAPSSSSRRRRALQAAFRLDDPDIVDPWGGSLTDRFRQLKALRSIFNAPTSTQPMEIAWKRGVRLLARYMPTRFTELQTLEDWQRYRPTDLPSAAETIFRRPSEGAQPIFVDLLVTTVYFKGTEIRRRVTERLITARADSVEYYSATGFTSDYTHGRTYGRNRALWGCRSDNPSAPDMTAARLWFPTPLQTGQQAQFASEAIFEKGEGGRRWVNVHVDHHGIAPGRTLYNGLHPISGLTIRVRFDEDSPPAAVWWYAETTERERDVRPPSGDSRLLTVSGRDVQYTFPRACQPREDYGLAMSWPAADE